MLFEHLRFARSCAHLRSFCVFLRPRRKALRPGTLQAHKNQGLLAGVNKDALTGSGAPPSRKIVLSGSCSKIKSPWTLGVQSLSPFVTRKSGHIWQI